MSDLNRIMELAKCSVYLEVNDHRAVYADAADHLAQFNDDELPPDIRAEMIRRDTIIEVYAYPRTPISSYHVLHYDLDAALRRMVEILEAEVTPDGIRSAPALGGTRLGAALRAVLDLHAPESEGWRGQSICPRCSYVDEDLIVQYPCDTVDALTEALGGTDA